MQHRRWFAATLVATSFIFSACAKAQAVPTERPSEATVEPVEGTDLSRVTLTPEAARRLGITTAPVRQTQGNRTGAAEIIPFSAVQYDAQGQAWAYTSPAPLTFLRSPIAVDHVDGELAYLRHGPARGTAVVTVGVAELFGAEYGVGGE
jgi:hypothetical protein